MSGMLYRRATGDSFVRSPLHCLSAAENLASFNPTELGRYRVKDGDTLPAIAAMYYGAQWRDMWRIIGAANGIPNELRLPIGLILIIPAPGWRVI
jgi:nucleoid-associated protein YgaU